MKEQWRDRISYMEETTSQPTQTSVIARINWTGLLYKIYELPQICQSPISSATKHHQNSRNFWGKTRTLLKNDPKTDFNFLSYKCKRRRLSLIKMIHGVEKVLIPLFPAFGYENLFWSVVVRVWIVRLFILEKIRFVSKRQTTKRRRRSNQKYLERKMFQRNCLGYFKIGV